MFKKMLGVFLVLITLAAAVSIVSANSNIAVSGSNTLTLKPNQLPTQYEDTKLPETQPLKVSELPQPVATVETAPVSDIESSETGTGCPLGWYSCDGDTMCCANSGCPSFVCGSAIERCESAYSDETITGGEWRCELFGTYGYVSFLWCSTIANITFLSPGIFCSGCCAKCSP